MSLELRSQCGDIAERNEEINRRRLQGPGRGGPLKVTDPEALARLVADLRLKAEQQRKVEEAREAERARREGAAYVPRDQRMRQAEGDEAGGGQGEEARSVDHKLDPKVDYYGLLGIDRAASAAEVKKAYKKLALLFHPDKHKAAGPEQRAAVAERFAAVAAAFDVLSDERSRALYDRVRDYQEANPGGGLPALSAEERRMMAAGMAELSRLRRQGAKHAKHAPVEREVWVSLRKLNAGGTKTVPVERARVDASGNAIRSLKNFHLVIRRGSREGDVTVLEGEGDEAADTRPGDLRLVLRAKPHASLRRAGDKGLEAFAGAAPPGHPFHLAEVGTLGGGRRALLCRALRCALGAGGAGGLWRAVAPGQGLFDPEDPWGRPAGDLAVTARYPAVFLADCALGSCLRPLPPHCAGVQPAAAAAAAGALAGALRHRREAEAMAAEGGGASAAEAGWPAGSALAVCLTLQPAPAGCGAARAGSPDAEAALRALASGLPGLRAVRIAAPLAAEPAAGAGLPGLMLLDEEWQALEAADVLVLECHLGECLLAAGEREAALQSLLAAADASGLLGVLWLRFWAGSGLLALGDACALLGRGQSGGGAAAAAGAAAPQEAAAGAPEVSAGPRVLPWYVVRTGGGPAGWAGLHAALHASPPGTLGVGVQSGGACVVDPWRGTAELLCAPTREALVQTAQWAAAQEETAGLEEAGDDDRGFFHAVRRTAA